MLQINLTGFLEKNASLFVKAGTPLLIDTTTGIREPSSLAAYVHLPATVCPLPSCMLG